MIPKMRTAFATKTITMNAVFRSAYGDPDQVLEYREIDVPTPKDNEVLVKIHAASVNAADRHLITGKPYLVRLMFGLRPKPGPVGLDCAGTVVAIGSKVQQLRLGDKVFGSHMGALAEYNAIPEQNLAIKPEPVSFGDAAATTVAAHTALVAVEQEAKVKEGQAVLVNGAAGGVGSFVVQLAKSKGATVTAVCSTRSIHKMTDIGASLAVDYTKSDFTQSSERYDVIVDTVGNREIRDFRRLLKPAGQYISVGKADAGNWIGFPVWALRLMFANMRGRQKFKLIYSEPTPGDMKILAQMLADGTFKPLIDGEPYELETAIGAIAKPHASGKRIIQIAGDQ